MNTTVFMGMRLWLFGFSKFSTVVIRDTFWQKLLFALLFSELKMSLCSSSTCGLSQDECLRSWEGVPPCKPGMPSHTHTHTLTPRMLYGGCIFIDRNLVQEELLRTAGAAGCGWGGILEDWLSRTLELQKGSVTTFPEELTVGWNFPGLPPFFKMN